MAEQNSQPVRVKHLRVKNFAAFDEYEMTPGELTIVSGGNGEGKTSIINALQTVFDGGNPVEMIRIGSDVAEIALELTDGVKINKNIVRNGKSTLKVIHPEYGPISAAKGYIDRISDAFSVSPAKLISGTPEERVKYILSALPIEVTPEQLAPILLPEMEAPKGHALQVLPKIRKDLESRRRYKHTQLDEKSASVAELRKSLPPEDATSVADRLAEVKVKLQKAQEEIDGRIAEVMNAYHRFDREIQDEREKFIASGESELRDAIRALEQAWQVKKDDYQRMVDSNHKDNLKLKEGGCNHIHSELDPVVNEFKAEITRLEERSAQEIRNQGIREMLARSEAQEADLRNAWEDLNNRVKRLDALDASLSADLPIAGLEIKDEDIYWNGVQWSQINTARKMDLVFEIAILRSGNLQFIFFEDIQDLDPENFELWKARALTCGRQILTTRVGSGPLHVETYQLELEAVQA